MIYKVQRSTCGKRLLVYNEDQTQCVERPYQGTPHMSPGSKEYWHGKLVGTVINLIRRAEAQEW